MPLRNAWLWTSLVLERASRAATFAAAGTMRLATLKAGLEQVWGDYAADGEDVDDGLMPWEQDVVSRFVRPADHVLLVGAGAGRDLFPLLALGCRVTALEPSPHAVAIFRRVLAQRSLSVPLVEGFFEDVALSGAFDVITFSYNCYSYIPVAARRVEVLRKAARHLAPGGRILLSCAPKLVPFDARYVTLGRWFGALTRSDWRMEYGDIVWRDARAVQYQHAFQAGEMDREVRSAGLRIVYHNPKGAAFVLEPAAGSPA